MKLAWISAALLLCSTTVVAQDLDPNRFLDPEIQTGSHLKQQAETASEADARETQKRVAHCVFYRNKDEVRQLLSHSDFDRIDFSAIDLSAEDLFDELDVPDCLARAMKHSQYKVYMRIPYPTLRNLLTEEAYLYDSDEPLDVPADAPQNLENRYGYSRLNPHAAVLAELSDCIVKSAPTEAHEFIASRPATSDEREAFERLTPALSICLGSDGEAREIDTSLIRQVVADGLWSRLHYGPQAGSVSNQSAMKDDDA